MAQTVGFIGIGVMGRPMAGHVLAKGYPLVVHTRTLSTAATLREAGARVLATPSEVAAASDVIITDKDTGNSFKSRIEVNKPLIHKGIAVYQASFDDGGTLIKIAARNMLGGATPIRTLEGRIGDVLAIELAGAKYQLEFSAFRPFNIENVGGPEPEASVGTLMSRMRSSLDSAARLQSKRELRNVGPSFQYKLRDAAGQAREYHNYMLPIQVDGRWFLMTGMRENPGDAFRFLRLPLDPAASLDEYSRLRDAVLNKALFPEVGRRFALSAAKADALGETMRTRLQETAERVLETFSTRGFQSVADFLDKAVPDSEREKAAEIYVRVLQGAAWEAWIGRIHGGRMWPWDRRSGGG